MLVPQEHAVRAVEGSLYRSRIAQMRRCRIRYQKTELAPAEPTGCSFLAKSDSARGCPCRQDISFHLADHTSVLETVRGRSSNTQNWKRIPSSPMMVDLPEPPIIGISGRTVDYVQR